MAALFIQNTNPVSVAPDQEAVKRGFARQDLFTVVHEQVMTDTSRMADIVLPATMFVEHDDVYQAGGQTHILLGPKLIEPPGDCLSNHEVLAGLARRLGVDHPSFSLSARDLIDDTLRASGRGSLADLEGARWIDCAQAPDRAHFRDGFGWPDGRFRFRPDWAGAATAMPGGGDASAMPRFPDHWAVIEEASAAHPFRMTTSPARNFLNSSFTETRTGLVKEERPSVMIHPDDAAPLGIAEGTAVELSNGRGAVRLHAKLFDGMRRGVLVAESIWPNGAHADGRGINTLTGADAPPPLGGAAVHDNAVAIRALVEG